MLVFRWCVSNLVVYSPLVCLCGQSLTSPHDWKSCLLFRQRRWCHSSRIHAVFFFQMPNLETHWWTTGCRVYMDRFFIRVSVFQITLQSATPLSIGWNYYALFIAHLVGFCLFLPGISFWFLFTYSIHTPSYLRFFLKIRHSPPPLSVTHRCISAGIYLHNPFKEKSIKHDSHG